MPYTSPQIYVPLRFAPKYMTLYLRQSTAVCINTSLYSACFGEKGKDSKVVAHIF